MLLAPYFYVMVVAIVAWTLMSGVQCLQTNACSLDGLELSLAWILSVGTMSTACETYAEAVQQIPSARPSDWITPQRVSAAKCAL